MNFDAIVLPSMSEFTLNGSYTPPVSGSDVDAEKILTDLKASGPNFRLGASYIDPNFTNKVVEITYLAPPPAPEPEPTPEPTPEPEPTPDTTPDTTPDESDALGTGTPDGAAPDAAMILATTSVFVLTTTMAALF